MKIPLACTTLIALACAPAHYTPAQATVTYTFTVASMSPYMERLVGSAGAFGFSITVSDAVFARGSVSLSHLGCGGEPGSCVMTGPWDEVAITGVTPLWGGGSVALTFRPDGTLDGHIVEDGRDQNLTLAGSGLHWASARYQSDRVPLCGPGADPDHRCAFAGYFQSTGPLPVPEPMSAALAGTGVLGVALTRRRQPG